MKNQTPLSWGQNIKITNAHTREGKRFIAKMKTLLRKEDAKRERQMAEILFQAPLSAQSHEKY